MKKFFGSCFRTVRSYLKTTDKMLLFMSLSLSIFSCVLLVSLQHMGEVTWKTVYMQMGASLVGFIVAIIMSLIDYQTMAKLWKIHVPITLGMMLLTLFTPLGQMRGGDGMGSDDRNWLNLGFISIQPSEFLKLSFILTFSLHCYKVRDHINEPKTLLLLFLHAAIPLALVFYSGDYGTLLIFILIFIAILFTAGLSWKLLAAGGILGAIGVFIFWNFILDDYLKNRFSLSQEYLYENRLGDSLQQYQGQITLGSGQLTGKGLFSDDLLTTTPELQNDFIFAHVGQVFGFVGCVVLIVWICVMCLKIILNARSAEDALGTYICVGVFTIFFFQSLINIGMVLCVLPVIGITLPFVSAGGSSALTTYMALGLALSVHNNTRRNVLFD